MPKYELSHPELPQFGGTLELPEGVEPTARDFWESVRSQVRPVGLSQLSDEAKLEAYQNGFFEDAPLQPGQPEPPSMTEGITDLFGKAFLSTFQPNSPYKKLMRLGKPSKFAKVFGWGPSKEAAKRLLPSESEGVQALQWRDEENPENPRFEYQKQYAEAGKILFGLLSTHEDDDKLDDPLGIAIRRAKLPHGFEKNEVARGKAYAAALDYSTGNIEAATGEGLVRAMQGGPFVAAGAELLFDKLTLSEDEPDEILDYVNSKIQFDKINKDYESADELAAFILENPQESLKGAFAGIAGGLTPVLEREDLNELLIDKEDLTMESKRLKDLQSGYMEPDPGVSFISEITLDPMNLAGAGAAKSLTFFQRAALAGRIQKTLIETQALARTQQAMARAAQKLPASSPSQPLFQQSLESVAGQLAAKQEILNKYARNSLTLRMAGRASPDELLKQSAKQLDTTTDVGRAVSGMVNDAATSSTKMGALRKALTKGAYFAPEVAGATIGGAMLGPLGAMAGATMPALIKGLRVLSTYPESVALRFMMRGATEAGEELTEAEAKRRWRSISRYLGLGTFAGLGSYSIVSREEGQEALGELGKIGGTLLGIKFLPQLSKFATTATRDLRAIGPELVFARGSEDSPFFNRLSQLPSSDEGLIGATRERFNTLTASTGDRLRDKLARPIEPFVTGAKLAGRAETPRPGQFRPGLSGKAPQLSNVSRGAARFLDAKVPELGRTIETLGRFGKMGAGGATIPATFGYLASGGQVEGALAGALVSAPFTSVGAGFGMFENFRTKADLYQRKIGDLQYYREHLSKDEKVSFDTLPLDARLAMSGFSLSHPDVIFEGVPRERAEGLGNYSPSKRKIVYDQDTGAGIIEGVLAHEVGHHIAIHGLNPVINRIMFGNSETGDVGVYGKYDAEGKIEPNAEFLELREFYLKRLIDTENIKPEDIDLYTGEEGNRLIAEEIFADHAADYLLSGKRAKDNTWRGKIFDQAFEAMTGPGFLRDLLLKLNVPMDSKGKFLEAGFFKGKAERIPALQNLIKQYYRDTRGLRAREIEGEKVIDPASGKELKKLSKTGARPVDDKFDQAFSLKDLEDPKLLQKLNTGGLFKYQVDKNGKPILDDDGNVKLELDLLGNPKKFTAGELKKRSKIQGDYAAKVLEKYGVAIRYDKEGKPFSDDFSHLDSRAIDELAKGPWHPKQIQALREISLALKEGDGERAGMLLGYFAASKNRKPGPVPFRIRKAVPYGFKLTKDGNVLVVLHDVAQLQKNLEFLKGGHGKLPKEFRKEYQNLFDGDDNQVWKDFAQYRRNTAQGRDGQDGLSDSPDEANRKKNFLNALHGAIDKEHVQLNPVLEGIGYDLASSNRSRSPFGAATKTFRLDRIFSTERSGTQASPVNVTRAKRMLMPQMELDFSPPKRATEAKPNFWKIYKIDPKGPKVYDEVADVLIQAGSPWMDGSIAESQAGLLKLDQNKLLQAMDRAHRRWERGDGKQFMPAGTNDPQIISLREQLEFLGGDEYMNGFKAQRYLNREETIGYLENLITFRRENQDILNKLGVDPAKKPLRAKMLAREQGIDMAPYDQSLKNISDFQRTAIERAQFRVKAGDNDILFMPAAYHGGPHTFPGEAEVVRASGKREFYPLKTKLPEDVVKEIQDGTARLTEHPLGRFRMDKIGTGEGAQAYGHGLYFASKKEVAEHYRKALTGNDPNRFTGDLEYKVKGIEVPKERIGHASIDLANHIESVLYSRKFSKLKGVEDYETSQIYKIYNRWAETADRKSPADRSTEALLDYWFDHAEKAKAVDIIENRGSLYKVELAPKENEYLLWDKPVPERFVDKIVKKSVEEGLVSDRKTAIEAIESNGADRQGSIFYRELSDQVGGDVAASQFLKEAGIPGIKYLDGSSRSKGKGDYNYVLFDEGDVTITEKMFMPASEAKNPKPGDMLTLDESSLKLFLPSPGNPNASLKDFNGKFVQVLTSDLSVVGDKKSDGVMISFQGGPGYLSVNDAWGFTNQGGARSFQTRWERDGRPLVGITSMKQENHRASTLTREYYVRKFMEAINEGKIAESTVNRHIRAALKRAIDGKNGLTNDQKAALKTVKTIEDFLRVFPDKELIPWKATPMIYEKLDLKGLPIKQDRLKKLGLDTSTILRETRQPEYNDIKKGSLLAIAEYDGSDAVYRPDLNSAYPWSIPLKEKAFLKDFADIQDLSSRRELRGPDGEANMAVAMGAGVMLDRLGRREVSFMPAADPKASKRQPGNRVQPQAPSMPANRFMAPASAVKGELGERFR